MSPPSGPLVVKTLTPAETVEAGKARPTRVPRIDRSRRRNPFRKRRDCQSKPIPILTSLQGEAERRTPRDTSESFAWDVLAASILALSRRPSCGGLLESAAARDPVRASARGNGAP